MLKGKSEREVLGFSRNSSTRHEEVNRLLTAQTRVDARHPAFFFQPRAHGRRCASGPFPEAGDLALHLFPGHLQPLAPGHFVESERAGDGFARRLALALAERVPVDAGLAGIDLLLHEPAREVLDAAVDLALDERGGRVERHAGSELLHEPGAHLALGAVTRFVLEILPHARAQSLEAVELAEVLRELIVERRED